MDFFNHIVNDAIFELKSLITELDRHSTIHTTNRPFACSSCPKKFGRKDKLVRHEKTHLEYFCPKCHLAFNRKDSMMLHMKVHEGNNEPPIGPIGMLNNEMFNSIVQPRNEYDSPMNLVVTEQTSVQQKMYSAWPNLDLHDMYAPFQ